MNGLIISNFYHTRSQQVDCFALYVFCSLRQHTKGQELKFSYSAIPQLGRHKRRFKKSSSTRISQRFHGENNGLNPQMCRAQTYDGAANIAGKEKGAAVYFHCTSHELNLSLSKASKILQAMNMVSTMQMLSIFFKYSPKLQQKLEQPIRVIASESLKKKVKPLRETR